MADTTMAKPDRIGPRGSARHHSAVASLRISSLLALEILRPAREAQRLIGTLRRECLDHVLIFGERHLQRVLTLYSLYYNETRTHLGLAKDAPIRRAVQ